MQIRHSIAALNNTHNLCSNMLSHSSTCSNLSNIPNRQGQWKHALSNRQGLQAVAALAEVMQVAVVVTWVAAVAATQVAAVVVVITKNKDQKKTPAEISAGVFMFYNLYNGN
jgi:hypothetical protein